ncbi:MAG: hypothetical protein N2516_03385, partial [Dictyoglomaceae bacterium]|nr:hypothetical protein [Dictyoglomaceae bacterium]
AEIKSSVALCSPIPVLYLSTKTLYPFLFISIATGNPSCIEATYENPPTGQIIAKGASFLPFKKKRQVFLVVLPLL